MQRTEEKLTEESVCRYGKFVKLQPSGATTRLVCWFQLKLCKLAARDLSRCPLSVLLLIYTVCQLKGVISEAWVPSVYPNVPRRLISLIMADNLTLFLGCHWCVYSVTFEFLSVCGAVTHTDRQTNGRLFGV